MATIRLRKTAKGEKRYHVQVRLRGAPPVCGSFETLQDARDWATDIESTIRRHTLLPQLESRRHTLAEAIDRYLETRLPQRRASTRKSTGILLAWWKDMLGAFTLDQLTPARIAAARDAMAALGRTPATRNRYVAALSAVFRVALREWMWAHANPCARISRLQEPPGRVRFLTEDEVPRLLKACYDSGSRRLYPSVLLSLAVGLRLGELMALRWEDVDLVNRTVIVRESEKTGQPRSLPIPEDVVHALKAYRNRGPIVSLTGRVFEGGRPGAKWPGFRGAFDRACRQAGIADFRWHDLRHSCGSYLAMAGVPIRTIAEILGHRNIQMTQRYTHFNQQHLRDAIDDLTRLMIRGAVDEQLQRQVLDEVRKAAEEADGPVAVDTIERAHAKAGGKALRKSPKSKKGGKN